MHLSTATPPRLPVVGINTNIDIDGAEYHVQTEDLAPKRPQLISHVFREGGCVVKVVKLDYSHHLDKPNLYTVLTRVMKVFHVKVLRSLQRQRLDSLPPSVNLRESLPPAAIVTNPPSVPPPPSQINASIPAQAEPPNSDPSESIGRVWDRIVEVAQKERLSLPTLNNRDAPRAISVENEEPLPSSTSWDRAVKSVRLTTRLDVPIVDANLGIHAYDQGLLLLRQGAIEQALVELARAVQAAPQNSLYRDALRRALDAMDEG